MLEDHWSSFVAPGHEPPRPEDVPTRDDILALDIRIREEAQATRAALKELSEQMLHLLGGQENTLASVHSGGGRGRRSAPSKKASRFVTPSAGLETRTGPPEPSPGVMSWESTCGVEARRPPRRRSQGSAQGSGEEERARLPLVYHTDATESETGTRTECDDLCGNRSNSLSRLPNTPSPPPPPGPPPGSPPQVAPSSDWSSICPKNNHQGLSAPEQESRQSVVVSPVAGQETRATPVLPARAAAASNECWVLGDRTHSAGEFKVAPDDGSPLSAVTDVERSALPERWMSVFEIHREMIQVVSREYTDNRRRTIWMGDYTWLRHRQLWSVKLVLRAFGQIPWMEGGGLARVVSTLYMVVYAGLTWWKGLQVVLDASDMSGWTQAIRGALWVIAVLSHVAAVCVFRTQHLNILVEYATCCGFVDMWSQQFVSLLKYCGALGSAFFLLEVVRSGLQADAVGLSALCATGQCMSFLLCCAGLYMVITFCSLAVDHYAIKLMTAPALSGLLASYNILAAVIRRAGFFLELSLLAATQLTLGLVGLSVFAGIQGDRDSTTDLALFSVSGSCVAVTLWLFNAAAVVNLKLERLPTLAIARNFGLEVDGEKWIFVGSLQAADAGIKMYNVRIDRRTIMKVGYYTVAVCGAMVPRLLS
mmetsp:Transcript_52152/g.138017  ORF Transcript_52152/g.138017 Transcript_52152/m.138017 type:complete len:650 (+) Transcript_52152:76-2025(+)